jgi:TonB family protein
MPGSLIVTASFVILFSLKRLTVKINCFIVCLVISLQATAQKTTMYYDYLWHPCDPLKARFYGELEKTDSGWLRKDYFLGNKRLQMQALYEDSACKIHNGQVLFYYANGRLSSRGQMVHNKNEGVCVSFHANGMMSDSAFYHDGRPVGYDFRWHANGMMLDSIAHINDSMDVKVSWFDNGSPDAAGYLLHGKMQGKWQFFHKNGKLAAKEVYERGKLISCEYYNEDEKMQTDTSKVHAGATFKGGLAGWQKYLQNNLYWPNGYAFTNGDMAVVVVDITINEDGKPENTEVSVPFHPEFDSIALKILRNSPNWQPAMNHNRKVKSRFSQPVTFRQTE